MTHFSPYQPFLDEYKTHPAMAKASDAMEYGVPAGTLGSGQFLHAHTSFMRPRLLNKSCGAGASRRRSAPGRPSGLPCGAAGKQHGARSQRCSRTHKEHAAARAGCLIRANYVRRNAHLGIERINSQFQVYWNDLFHTMLNVSRGVGLPGAAGRRGCRQQAAPGAGCKGL